MLGFRKKLFLSDVVLLIVFISALFPMISFSVNQIMRISLTNRTQALISRLKGSLDEQALVETMKEFIFQPAMLLDASGNVIYSSFSSKTDKGDEIYQAIKKGKGFDERTSFTFHEKYYLAATKFESHGKSYILDVIFWGNEVDELKFYFKVGMLVVCTLLLFAKSFLDTVIVRYVMQPVQQIIDTICAFQGGSEELPPKVVLKPAMQSREFSRLASTINALTERIRGQIDRLIRQKKESEEILESIGEGIIATDTSAKVTFINRAALQILEVSPNQILKTSLNKVSSSTIFHKCHELILYSLQTSEPLTETFTIREKGPLYFDLTSIPLAHQNGALLVLQNKTSDYKIVELGKDFIANASHELRTPITIIRGFAETLQDLPNISQEMLKDITEKIVRTCSRLDKLVRSLLTLSDIENVSQGRFKKTDLVLAVENCKHQLLVANPLVNVTLKAADEPIFILADADLLELAIFNLLENAVKYSVSPANIELHIEKKGQEVSFAVKDNGIGIPPSDLTQIFNRFYTVDKARSRKSGGAGLGLSIVKTIVEKHKGKIFASSQLGKGSLFTFTLPTHV